MANDHSASVWKPGKGKRTRTPQSRQIDGADWSGVDAFFKDRPWHHNPQIEYLHLVQDQFGRLSDAHLRALAQDIAFVSITLVETAANILANLARGPVGKAPEFKFAAVKVEQIADQTTPV